MRDGGTVLSFGDYILVAGYYYNTNGFSYYGAIYCFTTPHYSCEENIQLFDISNRTFIDNGHAIAWAMRKVK